MTNQPRQTKQQKLSELDARINERKTYLRAQTQLVDDAIAALNVRLQEFHHELQVENERKISLLRDIQQLEGDKVLIESKIAALETMYTERVERYKSHLQQLAG